MNLFSETKNTGESVNKFNDCLKESGTAFKNIGDKSLLSQQHLISGLICNYGVSTTSRLIGAVRHVPANFPNRTTYVYRIVNVGEGKEQLTETEISQYSALVQDVEAFQLSDELLWKCSLEYNGGVQLVSSSSNK